MVENNNIQSFDLTMHLKLIFFHQSLFPFLLFFSFSISHAFTRTRGFVNIPLCMQCIFLNSCCRAETTGSDETRDMRSTIDSFRTNSNNKKNPTKPEWVWPGFTQLKASKEDNSDCWNSAPPPRTAAGSSYCTLMAGISIGRCQASKAVSLSRVHSARVTCHSESSEGDGWHTGYCRTRAFPACGQRGISLDIYCSCKNDFPQEPLPLWDSSFLSLLPPVQAGFVRDICWLFVSRPLPFCLFFCQ